MLQRPETTPTGAVETTFHKLLARRADVRHVEHVGEVYRIVTLAGAELQRRRWTPGDMVQIAFAGWQHRAYTPFAYDPTRGSLDVLGYVHGHGMGSAWLAAPRLGEPLFLVGPRRGVDLNALRRPALFFGDETSLSTAAALLATSSGAHGVHFVFEVGSIDCARLALARIGVTDDAVTWIARQDDERHLDDVERRVLARFESSPEMHGVLTGQASSIQRLYKALRRCGVGAKRVTNVAYWAPGRKGLSGVQK